jgi:methylase of polypeptide subunit release factors
MTDMSLLRALLRNTELDSESAEDELRWMHQAVHEKHLSQEVEGELLREMVQLRAGGMPLQYILGSSSGPMTCTLADK